MLDAALKKAGLSDAEAGYLPLRPAEFFSKQTQRKMGEVQKLSGACRHVQSVEWQQMVGVSPLVLRRGFTQAPRLTPSGVFLPVLPMAPSWIGMGTNDGRHANPQ